MIKFLKLKKRGQNRQKYTKSLISISYKRSSKHQNSNQKHETNLQQ